MGISTLCGGFALHSMLFNDEYKILVIATKQEVAKNIIEKVQTAYEFLPNFLKSGIKIENNNKLQLALSNGSSIKAIASSPTAGRGDSIACLILDEAAHIDYADDIWTAAQPTLSTGGKCIMLSTPNGQQGLFYKIWQQAEEGTSIGGAKFNPISLPWYLHPDRDQTWRDEQDVVLGKREAAQECDCLAGDTHITIRDKITNIIQKITLKELNELISNGQLINM